MSDGFYGSVEEYVSFCHGDHCIKRILIANNGIGAIKAIRSIRRWAFQTFGNEKAVRAGITTLPCNKSNMALHLIH